MKAINNTNNNTYTVDFTARKIVVTAAFAKNAGEYGSDAYNIMMGLRRDLPEFKIETLAEKKKSKEPILTLDIMEAYIVRTYGTDSAEVKEFHTVLETSKAKKNKRYAYMKNWFHEVYPVGYNLLRGIDSSNEAELKRKEDALKVVNGKSERDTNKCIGCGICTTRCKFDAIHLIKKFDVRIHGMRFRNGFVENYRKNRQMKIAVKKFREEDNNRGDASKR
jgi:ferredoxin